MRIRAGVRCPNERPPSRSDRSACSAALRSVVSASRAAAPPALPAVRIRRRDLPLARRLGDGLREQLDCRRSNALRGTSFDASPTARVDRRRGPRLLRQPGDARDARQPVAAQRPPLRARPARRRRRAPAGRGGAVRLVDVRVHARRRSVRLPADGRRASGEGRRRCRLERPGDGRVPAAPAEQDPLSQRAAARSAAATSWSGSSRSPIGCAAQPLQLDARMDAQSILYRTLWLFGVTFVAVAVAFVLRDLVGHASGEIDQ